MDRRYYGFHVLPTWSIGPILNKVSMSMSNREFIRENDTRNIRIFHNVIIRLGSCNIFDFQ